MYTINAKRNEPIEIGHMNDNKAITVEFDVSETINKLGEGGTFTLSNKPAGAKLAYPCTDVTYESGKVKWTIHAADTAKTGFGSVQLTYALGDGLKHDEFYNTVVRPNLVPGGSVPDPMQSYMDSIAQTADDIRRNKEAAQMAQKMSQSNATAAAMSETSAAQAAQRAEWSRDDASNAAASALAYNNAAREASNDANRSNEAAASNASMANMYRIEAKNYWEFTSDAAQEVQGIKSEVLQSEVNADASARQAREAAASVPALLRNYVKKVNGIGPDENGNVQVPIVDTGARAEISNLQNKMQNKADSVTVNSALQSIANINQKVANNTTAIEQNSRLIAKNDNSISQNVADIKKLQEEDSRLNRELALKANKTEVPKKLSDLESDSTHRVVTDSEKNTWNAKSNFSGNYNDLSNKPTIPSRTSQLSNDSGYVRQADGYEGFRIKGGINSLVNNGNAVSVNPAVNGLGYCRMRFNTDFHLYLDGVEAFMTDAMWDRFFDGKLGTYVRFQTELVNDTRNIWNGSDTYPVGRIIAKRNSTNAVRWYRAKVENTNIIPIDENTSDTWEYLENSNSAGLDCIDFVKYGIVLTLDLDFGTSIAWENGLSLYWHAAQQNAKTLKVYKWNYQTNDWHTTVLSYEYATAEVVNTSFFGAIPSIQVGNTPVSRIKLEMTAYSNTWFALCQLCVTGLAGGIEGTVLNRGGDSLFGNVYPYANNSIDLGTGSYQFRRLYANNLQIGSTNLNESKLKEIINAGGGSSSGVESVKFTINSTASTTLQENGSVMLAHGALTSGIWLITQRIRVTPTVNNGLIYDGISSSSTSCSSWTDHNVNEANSAKIYTFTQLIRTNGGEYYTWLKTTHQATVAVTNSTYNIAVAVRVADY